MKKLLFGFLVGLAVGAGACWYYVEVLQPAERQAAQRRVNQVVEQATEAVQARTGEISTEAIKLAVARSGVYVVERAKQAGAAIADATADARITTTVKGKIITDTGMSGLRVHVSTSDGVVTLSGAVPTHEQINRAVRYALETEGVRKVISTIQVNPTK